MPTDRKNGLTSFDDLGITNPNSPRSRKGSGPGRGRGGNGRSRSRRGRGDGPPRGRGGAQGAPAVENFDDYDGPVSNVDRYSGPGWNEYMEGLEPGTGSAKDSWLSLLAQGIAMALGTVLAMIMYPPGMLITDRTVSEKNIAYVYGLVSFVLFMIIRSAINFELF